MAVYKVPQDVEAEDKLLGPFSFRQFVYLMIAGAAGFIGWLLWNISPFLIIIPIPIVVFFVVLALPLRKDQPMEIYLIALVQFLLKPKRRLWEPDGIISLVEITLPTVTERQRSKDLTEGEAVDRLSYLAQVMDTRGWATRGVDQPVMNQSMTADAFAEAQTVQDVMDTTAPVSQSFDSMIQQQDTSRRQNMIAQMQQQTGGGQATTAKPPQTTAQPQTSNPYDAYLQKAPPQDDAGVTTEEEANVQYNPYPTAIRQHVVKPLSARDTTSQPPTQPSADKPAAPTLPPKEKSASTIEVSPDIISLANNPDLSISTIAREAQRIQQRNENENEVEIPLR